ncbi:hypothetical protein FGO68_gene9735 [Halteria grandinella]|uniref:Uncharacterized protein n=1 Tax=Halteria grandinella TaxID=5974 RepID=A0A8J8P8H3_HALGN|nr:hypothetical protein FGO68_gene9735 [Halteria grandinella]
MPSCLLPELQCVRFIWQTIYHTQQVTIKRCALRKIIWGLVRAMMREQHQQCLGGWKTLGRTVGSTSLLRIQALIRKVN